MKKIYLRRLELENFKCHRHLVLEPEGEITRILGDNGAGKTSVSDGFCWLLYGRDSRGTGEKALNLKPLGPDGEVADRNAVTAVKAVLEVDGRKRTLERTLREQWTQIRGSGGPRFSGNVCEYFVDGEPVKKGTFDREVEALVPEEQFRMLTDTGYFAGTMKWQQRRAILFSMADTREDRELMAEEPRFFPLLEAMEGTEDLHRKLLLRKKELTGIREDTPARISECRRLLDQLQAVDFEKARREETKAREALDRAEDALRRQEEGLSLREARLRLAQIRSQAPDLEGLDWKSREAARSLEAQEELLASANRQLENLSREMDRLDRATEEAEKMDFTGETCPLCGQKLPEDQLEAHRREFREDRQRRLRGIRNQKEQVRLELDALRSRLPEQQEGLKQRKEKLEALERQRKLARENDRFRAREQEAQAEVDRLTALRQTGDRRALEARRDAAREALAGAREILAKQPAAEETRSRIRELERSREKAEQALAEVNRLLGLEEDFLRYRAEKIEEGVNDLFSLASFRLFKTQANGGLEERCDATYRGVPYGDLNNGMRVNLGLDIIRSLSRFYGLSLPIFVDNAEAVTRLLSAGTQQIRLTVSAENPTLRILPGDLREQGLG